MIMVWLMVAVGLFSTGVTYFYLTPIIMNLLTQFVTHGAPSEYIDIISTCYHTGFVILCIGIVAYGIIYSTKTEPDTYKI
jgi:hypothetical protein